MKECLHPGSLLERPAETEQVFQALSGLPRAVRLARDEIAQCHVGDLGFDLLEPQRVGVERITGEWRSEFVGNEVLSESVVALFSPRIVRPVDQLRPAPPPAACAVEFDDP